MKRTLLILATLLFSISAVFAQKVGYVNTQTILSQIPDYVSAQQTLEKLGNQYKQYLENESSKIEAAYRQYQADRARLTESQKQVRENEIISMERSLQEKQKEYFGEEGIMVVKSEQLIGPIKNQVDAAIKRVADKQGYSLIIDVSSMQGIVYKNDTYDLSMEVLRNL